MEMNAERVAQIARFVEAHSGPCQFTGTDIREIEKELLALGLDVEFADGPFGEHLSVRAKEK